MGVVRCMIVFALCALAAAGVGAARQQYPCCTCGDHGLLSPPRADETEDGMVTGHWKPFMDAKEFCDSQSGKVELQGKRLEALPDCLSPFAVELNVSYNHLHSLPPSSQLNPLLIVLDVSSNNASSSGSELRSLTALEVLRVGGNRLQDLRFLPDPCALRRLHAASNAIASLEGPLRRCALLEELDLSSNALQRLDGGEFFSLARLRELYLARNPLRQLVPRVFAGLARLRLLDLGYTGLRELPTGIFDGLPMLEHVILRGNELSSVPGRLFTEQSLLSLDVSFNQLSAIPSSIKRLPSLEKLQLSGNHIDAIPEKAFRKSKMLRELALADNALQSLSPGALFGLSSLEKLDLSSNPLENLHGGVLHDVPNLEALDVSGCPLADLSFAQGVKFKKLQRVDVMDSKVRSVPADAFATAPNLQCLNMQGSTLGAVRPRAFAGLSALRALFLGSGEGQLKQLSKDTFAELVVLEKIDLRGHKLETLPKGVFKKNAQLMDINLQSNLISTLPEGVFSGLRYLQRLILTDNKLTSLPLMRHCCSELSYASFQNNSIASPSKEALITLMSASSKESVVDLRGNPLQPRALLQLAHENALQESGGAGEGGVRAARSSRACACGGVRRGGALLRACVDAPCGDKDTWATLAEMTGDKHA